MTNQMYEKVLEVKGMVKGAIRWIMPDIGFVVLSGIKKQGRCIFFYCNRLY